MDPQRQAVNYYTIELESGESGSQRGGGVVRDEGDLAEMPKGCPASSSTSETFFEAVRRTWCFERA